MVAAYSVSDYAATMADMYHSGDLTEMGVAGRHFARRFDWEEIAIQQEHAYQATLTHGSVPAAGRRPLLAGG
jgi:hypothetical protein